MKKLSIFIISIAIICSVFSACTENSVSGESSMNSSSENSKPQGDENNMVSDNKGYIIATDYMPADGITDVSEHLQELINENPNSTIFFPDGVYLISKPILTPANPKKSVDLQLSNFACLKVSDNWTSDEAMIRLGAKDPSNDISTPGSNYGINGGIIDGSGKAKAISIDGGRETYIRNVNIKNAPVGIHIKSGANNGSSDADINSVNIVGTGSLDSIGVLVEGFDNTLTNIRIANVFTGVEISSGGNMLRNVHPLFYISDDTYDHYNESVGFRVNNPMNWFDYCYSDQFAIGFDTMGGGIFKNCFCWWYSDKEPLHLAVRSKLPFFGNVDTMVIGGSHHPDYPNQFMDLENVSEIGVIENIISLSPKGMPSLIK